MNHVQMEEISPHFWAAVRCWTELLLRISWCSSRNYLQAVRQVIYISVVFSSSDIYCMVTSRWVIRADSSALLASSPAISFEMHFPFSAVSVPSSFSRLIFPSRACVVIFPLSPHLSLLQLIASLTFFNLMPGFPRCFLCFYLTQYCVKLKL